MKAKTHSNSRRVALVSGGVSPSATGGRTSALCVDRSRLVAGCVLFGSVCPYGVQSLLSKNKEACSVQFLGIRIVSLWARLWALLRIYAVYQFHSFLVGTVASVEERNNRGHNVMSYLEEGMSLA